MQTDTPTREALSIGEAARAANISRALLYKLLSAGEGPPTLTVGQRRLIRVEALREWLRSREGDYRTGRDGDGNGD